MASEDLKESQMNHFYGVFMASFTLALIIEECNLIIPLTSSFVFLKIMQILKRHEGERMMTEFKFFG